MELKQYWAIIQRRLWMVVGLTLAALLVSGMLTFLVAPSYVATMRLVLSVPSEEPQGQFFRYEKIYTFQTSEYLIDDFSELVTSTAFAQDVKAELGDTNVDLTGFTGTRGRKVHRIFTLQVRSPNPDEAKRLADAAARVIEKKGGEYLAQLQYSQAQVRIIDPPIVAREGGLLGILLKIAAPSALALLAGLALTFLFHYLDGALYEVGEVEGLLGVPVLGRIPPES